MNWPGSPSDRDVQITPSYYLFENYYPELYKKGQIFEGFSTKYHDGIVSENVKKVALRMAQQSKYESDRASHKMYLGMYNYRYGEHPIFLIDAREKDLKIYLPEYLCIICLHRERYTDRISVQGNNYLMEVRTNEPV